MEAVVDAYESGVVGGIAHLWVGEDVLVDAKPGLLSCGKLQSS
jgi:hypothetical protein